MEITLPSTGYAVLSKSGCPNCRYVKNVLKRLGAKIEEIDCDEYLLENRTAFMEHLTTIGVPEDAPRTFPFMFFDGKYLGGLRELEEKLNQ